MMRLISSSSGGRAGLAREGEYRERWDRPGLPDLRLANLRIHIPSQLRQTQNQTAHTPLESLLMSRLQ